MAFARVLILQLYFLDQRFGLKLFIINLLNSKSMNKQIKITQYLVYQAKLYIFAGF